MLMRRAYLIFSKYRRSAGQRPDGVGHPGAGQDRSQELVAVIGADDGRDIGGRLLQPVVQRVEEAERDVGGHPRHLRVLLVDQVHLHGREDDDLVPGDEHGAGHWAEG